MTYLLIAVFLIVIIYVILTIIAKRPYYRKNLSLEEVKPYLHALLKRGYDGGFIIIQDMESERFVQFSKYIKGKGSIGIELSFPRAPWSEAYYEMLKNFLRNQNISFVIQPVKSEPVTEFIDVNCGPDIDLAFRLVEGIFYDVFQIRRDLLFTVKPVNISVKDELIDS